MQQYEITLPAIDGGMNLNQPEYAIADNQSPDILNMWYQGNALEKRPGQSLVTTLANCYRVSKLYNSYYVVHAGTVLYKWNGTTATSIKTGIANSAGVFVSLADDLYYFDGTEIWAISSTLTVAAVSPYVPTVLINCTPTLTSSETSEDYNLIGAGFKVTYNGDGTATYNLPLTSLDATEIVVVVGGVTKTKTTHYTWVPSTGVVTFTGGNEPASGTNNVWITAYKTVSGNKAKIASCDIAVAHGGESSGTSGGTRVFVMGNSTYPTTYWRSDLSTGQGVTYFPDTTYEVLDETTEAITTAAKMGGELIIFKSNSFTVVGYEFDGSDVYYPMRTGNATIGCDIPRSVQLIDNRLVFGNTKTGLHILISTNNELENIAKPISANINSLLLKESSLANAVSTDFNQYYWLAVNGNVYLWDYGHTPFYNYSDYEKAQKRLAWYLFDGITPTDFLSIDNLYYCKTTGMVKFVNSKNDFDAAYNSHVLTKAFDLGQPEVLKTFQDLYISFSSSENAYATVTVSNEDTDNYKNETYDLKSFSWENFRWDMFTWNTIKYADTHRLRLKMKKKIYAQIKVENETADRGIGLAGLKLTYFPIRKVKH